MIEYAVHQPDFFPWVGFFRKIALSDVFVIIDDVQFPKTGGNYMNRVKLLFNGRPKWFTAPVVRNFSGVKAVNEVYFRDLLWKKKLRKSFEINYANCPFFLDVFEMLKKILSIEEKLIYKSNMIAIEVICDHLNIDTGKFVFSSSLDINSVRTKRLIDIGLAVGGGVYRSGSGGKGYQDAHAYADAGIQLVYQKVVQPPYPQPHTDSFVSGLSILDVLANCGFEQTKKIVIAKA